MQKIINSFTFLPALLITSFCFAQQDSSVSKSLEQVIVTGQYKPQSLKKSVYQIRTINNQRIVLSGATNIQQVLNTQLGFRFSNDNTLGTTDVQLMGMSGRNVKILLDGVPMIDRGDTRESLNQVDINTIERIEIVEGPMSVSYGSDALAGVINIITKKNIPNNFSITAKVQEETAGAAYYPFSYKGVHLQNIGVNYKKNSWAVSFGGTHNNHNGFGGDAYGRGKTWKPKEQWLGNAKIGYSKGALNIYYRLDGLNEDIVSRNPINFSNYKTIDQQYNTKRLAHQLQGGYNFNGRLQMTTILGYTNYSRRTKTIKHDFERNTNELTTGDGEQDIAKFNSFVFRNTLQYQISSKIIVQPGIDINREEASGQRILGNPSITDYAAFISAEIKPTDKINIRPGLRFIKNSVYNAPPVIPSVNAKFILSDILDVRLAYAYGFRSPALRELYFNFVDANHNIVGNPRLKAEYSNSFTGSVNFSPVLKSNLKYNVVLSGFFNDFNNQIDFALASATSNQFTYFNVNNAKTTGGSIENKITYKNIDAALGFSYIGYYRQLYDDKDYIKEETKDFLWTPEVNTTISCAVNALKTKLSLFYKYTGKKPQLVTGKNTANQPVLLTTQVAAFHLADFTTYTTLNKYIGVTAGVKNIFDVTNVNNSAASSTSIHSSGNSVAISYGRSYFLGLNFKWSKK
jgi:outer membrane receptor for ferrienterochelin and colicins